MFKKITDKNIVKGHLFLLMLFFLVLNLPCYPVFSASEASDDGQSKSVYTLSNTIERAIEANLGLEIARDSVRAAEAAKKAQRANFLPSITINYQYKNRDHEKSSSPIVIFGTVISPGYVTVPRNEYTLSTTITQPIFTGFSILNGYKLASLGLDAAKINQDLTRQNIVFEAKRAYYSTLRAEKLLMIAREAVTQVEAHKEVAKNFYDVGMTPLNDLLKAQVELANIKQRLITARNGTDIARSNFNTILRRPVSSPVELEDVLQYTPFQEELLDCMEIAEKNRFEIKLADLEVEMAEKQVRLAQKDYSPSVMFQYNYYQMGTDWDTRGGGRGIQDKYRWEAKITASWKVWDWGKTYYGIKEELYKLSRAKHQKDNLLDQIRLEVKQAYLNTREAEQNIETVKQAIEQAKENFRISEERYKEQMATSTDVLDAQTLLSSTMTNYYSALYDFKISKAALYRAMNRQGDPSAAK